MKISLHAGHNINGSRACGAVGYVDESKYTRKILESVKAYWNTSVPFNDCTVNDGVSSQSGVLKKLVTNINAYDPTYAVSLHMNSFSNTSAEGFEVLVHKNTTASNKALAEFIVNDMCSAFGFKNRGVKEVDNLYLLTHTNCPCMILEIGFVTNYHDSNIVMKQYDAIGARIAHILSGVTTPSKLYDVKVYGVNETDAKKITDIAHSADVVYQKRER